jgi:prepilin-type processing-associated H-X9-DG protein
VALTEPGPSGAGSFAWNAAAGTGTPTAGRTDYAINCGDPAHNEAWTSTPSPGTGPALSGSSVDAVENSFTWCLGPSGKVIGPSGCSTEATGVSFQRSEVSIRQIPDGTSKTYLIGEKYLCPQNYETGSDDGDDETWCTGYNNDNYRSTILPPQKDRPDYVNAVVFGSAHAGVFQISFCDGHVEGISYDIDPKLHRSYGNRKDGSIAGEIW